MEKCNSIGGIVAIMPTEAHPKRWVLHHFACPGWLVLANVNMLAHANFIVKRFCTFILLLFLWTVRLHSVGRSHLHRSRAIFICQNFQKTINKLSQGRYSVLVISFS